MVSRSRAFVSRGAIFAISALALTLPSLLTASDAHAQACPAGKFCYYVPPGMKFSHSSTQDWDLVLASSFGTVTGTYRIGTSAPVAFSVDTTTPIEVDLTTSQGVVGNYESAENRGVYIEADSDALNVTHRRDAGNEQASATVKDHTRALGTRFRLGGYSLNGTGGPDAGYDIVSIYSPTGATVTLEAPPGAPMDYWQGYTGTTLVVSLSAGETFMQRTKIRTADADYESDGALVTSDRAISVSSGGRGWASVSGPFSTNHGGCGDDGRDHIFPTRSIGTEYVVTQLSTSGSRQVSVIADTDDTEVTLDGVVVDTLDAGESYKFRASAAHRIQTSQPAYVYHNTGRGSSCELGLAFVPPLAFQSGVLNTAAFAVAGSGRAVIVIEATNVASILLDGAALSGASSQAVPGRTDLSVVIVDGVASGNHVIEANGDFQLGVAAHTGPSGLYAYYNIFNVAGCGDGAVDAGEGCDDGNRVNGDGCSAQCKLEILEPGCSTDDDCVAGAFCNASNVCVACLGDADCNDALSCTSDVCNADGTCSNTALSAGDACAGGVCNGDNSAPLCVTCIDDNPAGVADTGCPDNVLISCDTTGPVAQCVGCVVDADCDDGNSCTTNTCGAGGVCNKATVAKGTSCDMGAGVCNGSDVAPSCDVCVVDGSSAVDPGCMMAEPFCDRSGTAPGCVECLSTNDCQAGSLCDGGKECAVSAVAISSPANGGTSTSPANISGTATPEASVTVVIRDSMGVIVQTLAVTAFGGNWNLSSDPLVPGVYSVEASVEASGGDISDTSTFTVLKANGEACTMNAECGSGFCDAGECACDDNGDCSVGQVCDTTETPNACESVNECGNGVVEAGEACDDGGVATNDGCDAACAVESGSSCSCAAPEFSYTGANQAGAIGGVGGSAAPPFTCPSDEVIIGLGFEISNAQQNATRTKVICGSVDVANDGTVTTTAATTSTFGGVGCAGWDPSVATSDVQCPSGQVIVGLKALGVGGTLFSDVTLICAPIKADGSIDLSQEQEVFVTGSEGAGSVAQEVRCASGELAQGFNARAGCGQDALDLTCAQASVSCDGQASVCLDLTPPPLSIDDPADGAVLRDKRPAISGTTEAGAEVTISIDGGATTTVTANGMGAWTFTPSSDLSGGAHTVTASASDAAGNTTAPVMSSFTILLDNGEMCTANSECASDFCDNGVCACDGDNDCAAGEVCNTMTAPNECLVGGDDADMDTLTNAEELGIGTNPNNPDTDGDGVRDDVEVGDVNMPTNTDMDMLINALDPDDDNDGILTTAENYDGDTDPTNDNSDASTGDMTPDYLDTDDDGDGKSTLSEDVNGNGDYTDDDTDGDMIPDYLDPNDNDGPNGDLDMDGLTNGQEMGLGTNPNDPDSDGDGIRDPEEVGDPMNPTNTDMDMLINALDPDDDGDGVDTSMEDTNGNGDPSDDINGNGIASYLDPCDPDPTVAACGSGDTDGDGTPNDMDPAPLDPCNPNPNALACDSGDTDMDGLTNGQERGIGTNPNDPDTDGDGVRDGVEVGDPMNPTNTDMDMLIDALDTDDDGDGIETADESYDGDTDPTNDDTDADMTPDYLDVDDDGDGIDTADEDLDGDSDPTNDNTDAGDGDTTPNYLDVDDDGDGKLTEDEDINGNGDYGDDDTDGDMIPDYLDADDNDGPLGDVDMDGIPNEDEDLDGDGDWTNDDTDMDMIPDFEDPDDDGDGVLTADEDRDGDGDPTNDNSDEALGDMTPDYLDTDDDGDGVDTRDEDVDMDGDPTNDDTNMDSVPDFLDPCDPDPASAACANGDTDGDGTINSMDPAPLDPCVPNPDALACDSGDTDMDGLPNGTERMLGTDPELQDTDMDGIFDGFEVTDPAAPEDTDMDGDIDALDPDDDGDGVPTIDENADPNGDGNPDDALDSNENGTPDYLDATFPPAPAVGITAPAEGDEVGADFTVTGTANPGDEVAVLIDGAEVGTVTADDEGNWSFDVTGLEPGAHTVEATTEGAAAGPVNVTVLAADEVAIAAPADGSEVSADFTVSGTANPGAEVTVTIGDAEVGTATADDDGNWTLDVTGQEPGEVTVTATNGDASESVTVTVAEEMGELEVVVTSPSGGDTVEVPVTVTGTATPGAEIEITIDGKVVGTTTADDDGNWSIDVDEDLEPGDHDLGVSVKLGDDEVTGDTITINVPDEFESYYLTGGCNQAPGAPADLGWLALLGGLVFLRRRRR